MENNRTEQCASPASCLEGQTYRSVSPSAVRYQQLQPQQTQVYCKKGLNTTELNSGFRSLLLIKLKIIRNVFSFCRGCPCRHGRQRRAAGSGSQPGQRVDPQTRLQEHTRYSELTSLAAYVTESDAFPVCSFVNFIVFLLFLFCFVCCVCSDVCEGVCPGEWSVLG